MSDVAMERKVLIRAAEIVTGGWCQGRFIDAKGRVCMSEALSRAVREIDAGSIVASRAYDRVLTHLPPGYGCFSEWNDAPGRTADEVEAALRAAAEHCDRG